MPIGRKTRLILVAVVLLLALAQDWSGRDVFNTDGLSYLEMGEGLSHGNWKLAVNGTWSPLFPLILGVATRLLKPAPLHEMAVLHAVNFAILVFALLCFEFLLRQVLRWRDEVWPETDGDTRISSAGITLLGYAVFAWCALDLFTLRLLAPDLLQSGFLYIAFALLLRSRTKTLNWRDSVLLGLALAFAYLAKAPALPVALLVIGVTFVSQVSRPHGLARTALATVVFAVTIAPLVLALTHDRGHLTFGESARINYAWYVAGAPYRHWQGENAPGSSGIPRHPTRKILAEPPVYEFASPLPGTYPVWIDPSYWYEGIQIRIAARRQAGRLISNVKGLYAFFFNPHAIQQARRGKEGTLFSFVLLGFLAVLLPILALRSGSARRLMLDVVRHASFLILPCLAAIAMFSLVWVEARYVAAYFAVLVMVLLATVRLPATAANRRILALAPACLAILCVTLLTSERLRGFSVPTPMADDWQVAQAVRTLGVHNVGVLEYANHQHYRWARLARVRIVAEVYVDAFRQDGEEVFWGAGEAAQRQAIDAFQRGGADAIVSREPPRGATASQWRAVGPYYAYLLSPPAHHSATASESPAARLVNR
jgi:hypothetical protein